MTKDNYYLNLAFEIAKASKCVRAQYGSVIVSKDGRVVSTGYNGKPRGSINDTVCYRIGLPDNSPAKENCCLHSEANAITFCNPLERHDATIYVSGIPCTDCLLLIMQSGITRVIYFSGEQSHGHSGNSNQDFLDKYGFSNTIEFKAIETLKV